MIGRLSGASTYLGRTCGRKQLFMNDLTTKMLPLDQARFERMFISCTNTVKDGVWGWENMSPTLLGKATNLVRKLRDEYLSALGEYDVLITPTLPYVAQRLPAEGAGIEEMMENSAGVSINTSPFNLVRPSPSHEERLTGVMVDWTPCAIAAYRLPSLSRRRESKAPCRDADRGEDVWGRDDLPRCVRLGTGDRLEDLCVIPRRTDGTWRR